MDVYYAGYGNACCSSFDALLPDKKGMQFYFTRAMPVNRKSKIIPFGQFPMSLRVWYSLFQRIHIINIYVFVAINSFFKTTSTDKTYLLVFKFRDTLNLLHFFMDFID